MAAVRAPYLDWQPRLEPGQIYSQPAAPQYPGFDQGQMYFIEQRAAEGGRSVLVRLEDDDSLTCLTPDGYNLRSRVHEYGGKSHLLHNGAVYFSNDADGVIYRQELKTGTVPRSLLAADADAGLSIDFQITPDERFLVFVHERSRPDSENENRICYIGLDRPDSIKELVAGADFYASPVLAEDARRLAWVEWDHPAMPWDCSLLKCGRLVRQGDELLLDKESVQVIAGGSGCAVCQPQFGPDGRLVFALDGNDEQRGLSAASWDLFAWQDDAIERLTQDDAEYGEAFWVFGQQRYRIHPDKDITAIRTRNGRDEMVHIDGSSGTVRPISVSGDTSISHLSGRGQESLFRAASFRQDFAIYLDAPGPSARRRLYGHDVLLSDRDISEPQRLDYPTRDGAIAHALYYPPRNSAWLPIENDLPPMLVMVHGGPTHRCEASFSLLRQYWTGRGFAVLDVNHRGSTGYGRTYRQALRGQWGLLDAADVADAVTYTIDHAMAHAKRICIRGGSAGGYAVLRTLTLYPELFCAGACYYGIGNLVTLMEITHKFEAHYLDGLLGEAYAGPASNRPGSAYYDRSPIHHLDALQSPMIIFQGLDDKVVPPAVSREIVQVLEEKGIYHQYVEYAGEGHGFRSKETRIDALQMEAAFFLNVIHGRD